MKNIRKIIIISVFLVFIIEFAVYARYNYTYNIPAFSLTRDDSEIVYSIRKIPNTYTNGNVKLEIETNKAINSVVRF